MSFLAGTGAGEGAARACGNRLVKRRALYNAERSLGLRGEKWRENIKVGEYKLRGGGARGRRDAGNLVIRSRRSHGSRAAEASSAAGCVEPVTEFYTIRGAAIADSE